VGKDRKAGNRTAHLKGSWKHKKETAAVVETWTREKLWEFLESRGIYSPFARQEEFHARAAKYRLFGGAAGPGKTKALLWEAIVQALAINGSDTLLLRRTFPELELSLLAQFRRDVPRDFYHSYNEAKHLVTWTNGSTTRFGYCRNENDVYQYQGAEFLFIGIDELTHFTLKQWQFLTSRNRCPIPGSTCGMAGATNPGNIGHGWVKALWIDKTAPAGYDRPEQYDPGDYDFTPARIADNPIYANDKNYLKTLDALPDRLRRAFLEGDWSVFAGQYFDLFEIGRHTARAEEIGIQDWWPRWISIDWGFHHPSAVYWHCVVPELAREERAFAGAREDLGNDYGSRAHGARIVTYREFLKSGLSPRMLGQAIAERNNGERVREVVLSPDAFAHRTCEASIAEQLGEVLEQNGLPRPVGAQDDRVGGWQLMYQLLENDQWTITENCRELLECLPQLVRDERRVEDVRKAEGDDAADAARYGIVSGVRYAGFGALATGGRPGAGQTPPDFPDGQARFVPGMPLDVQIQRQISAEDPTSRAIHSMRLESEAKRQLGAHKFGKRRWKW
jgi:phage terminase large subunit